MTNAVIENSVKGLISHIQQGKFMEAFDKYYDDNVVMQENENAPMTGKEANRRREQEFFSKVSGYENGKVEGIAVGDDLTTVIWDLAYKHQDWGNMKIKQVSVQHWKNGKIVKEQFFYGR